MTDLSPLDRRLIAALKTDARASVTNLAHTLGVSRATVQARLERLVSSGIIRRFTVDLDPLADTETIRAVMMIEIVGKSTAAVIRRLRAIPELRSLYSTNGNWDLIAEIETGGLGEFDRVLGIIRSIDGIAKSETNLLLSSV